MEYVSKMSSCNVYDNVKVRIESSFFAVVRQLTMMVSPTSPPTTASLTRLKLGSKRLCRPVMSFTPASLQALMASTVSARSVARGFSQNTCLPLAAHALICSAWYWEGEQIQTASTSGSVITSMASPVKRGTPKSAAAVIVNEQAKNIVSRNEEDCKMRKESNSKRYEWLKDTGSSGRYHIHCEGNISSLFWLSPSFCLFGYL